MTAPLPTAHVVSQSPVADTTVGWIVAASLLAVVLYLATVRFVRVNERLVVFRLGRIVAVKGPGLAPVLPGLHRTMRVSLNPTRLDLLWLDANTKDKVPVTVNATAVATVVDPAAYALHFVGLEDTPIKTVVETEIRRHLAESTLADLSEDTDDDHHRLIARINAHAHEWGVETGQLELSRVEARLPEDLIRWAEQSTKNRSPSIVEAESAGITRTRVPGAGTVHHCVTRGGQHVSVLVDTTGNRRLMVYGSADLDVPSQTIIMEPDEADQVADLLHSRPVVERLTALERRVAEIAREAR